MVYVAVVVATIADLLPGCSMRDPQSLKNLSGCCVLRLQLSRSLSVIRIAVHYTYVCVNSLGDFPEYFEPIIDEVQLPSCSAPP